MNLAGILAVISLLLPGATAAATWREYPQAHLKLITNLSEARAERLMTHLRWFRHVADAFIQPPVHEHLPPVRLVVFATRKTYNKVVNQRHFAAYTQPDIAGTTLVVGPEENGDVIQSSLHEYVHYRLRTQAMAFPRWYEEGLAVLLSATEFTPAEQPSNARVGYKLPAKLQYNALPLPSPASLLTSADAENWPLTRMAGYYKQSAQLLRYLLHAEHHTVDIQSALQQHLQHRDLPLLDLLQTDAATLARNVKQFNHSAGRARTLSMPVDLVDRMMPATSVKLLTKLQEWQLKAELAEAPNPRYAAAMYRRMTRQQPQQVRYWAWLARAQMDNNQTQAATALATAAALNPDHPDVLIQQTRLNLRRCPMDASLQCLPVWRAASSTLRRALAQDPQHFQAVLWLGITELYSGRAGSGVNYLRIAHQRAPWSAMVNFHLGECLRLLGNPRGRMHLQQAVWWAQDPELKAAASLALSNWQMPSQ